MSPRALGSPNRSCQEPVSTARRHEQFVNVDLLAKIKIYLVQYITMLELVYREYKPLIYKTDMYRGREEDK